MARLEGDSSNRLFDILTEWETQLQHLPQDEIRELLGTDLPDAGGPVP